MRKIAAFLAVCALARAQQPDTAAAVEAARIRALVEAGALPASKLAEADGVIADARDEATLRRTLYGNVRLEELTEDQAEEMLQAAQHRLDRQRARVEIHRNLVDLGAAPRLSLTSLVEELDFRRRTLDLATTRAALLRELSAIVQQEAEWSKNENVAPEMLGISERYAGDGIFPLSEFVRIELEYQKRFSKPLPVSANGATALHRSLGFDHRGRIDVALDPDQPEGRWLRGYLQTLRIPYFAFRSWVRGKSTGPHIHIGPPSEHMRAGG